MNKIYDFVETICLSALTVTFVMVFLFRVVSVDGESMTNTLQNNDRLIITTLYSDLQRGDVVVTDNSNGTGKLLIKRVVAVAGDTIRIDYTSGQVYLNGSALSEEYIREPMNVSNREPLEVTVPRGQVFLMGDNRNNSRDSRSREVGTIETHSIMGKAILRIFPLNRIKVGF